MPSIPPEFMIQFPDHVASAICRERDEEVLRLEAQAREIREMTAAEYVARGFSVHALKSFDLVGRMTKAGWTTLHYNFGAHCWLAYTPSSESKVSPALISAMLAGKDMTEAPER